MTKLLKLPNTSIKGYNIDVHFFNFGDKPTINLMKQLQASI